MPEIRDLDLKVLVERWLRKSLDETERYRLELPPLSESGQQEVLRELSYWEKTYREALGRGDLAMTREQADLLFREQGVKVASDAPELRVVTRELLKASIVAVKEEQRRFRGEFDEATILPIRIINNTGPVVSVKSVTAIAEPIPLSKAFDGFEAEMVAGQRWTEKTRAENRAMWSARKHDGFGNRVGDTRHHGHGGDPAVSAGALIDLSHRHRPPDC